MIALLPATAFVAIVFFTRIGFREDIDAALRTVRFQFKFVVIVPLALVTLGALFRSAGPISALGRWAILLPLPLLLLCAGVAAELLSIPRSDWMVRLIGSNAMNCMTLIPLLASRSAGDLHHGAEEWRTGASGIEWRDGGTCRGQPRCRVLCHELF